MEVSPTSTWRHPSWVPNRQHFQKDVLVSPQVAAALKELLGLVWFLAGRALLDAYINVCERIVKLLKESMI